MADVLPGATRIENQGQLFVGYDAIGESGWVCCRVGEASGYGGPIEMLVGVDPDGEILGSSIVAQRESPGFFRLVENSGLIEAYAGLMITDPLQLGEDLDAVSGATVSSEGIGESGANGRFSKLPAMVLMRRCPQRNSPSNLVSLKSYSFSFLRLALWLTECAIASGKNGSAGAR